MAKRTACFVRIDRKSAWGNPFLSPNTGRGRVAAYRDYLLCTPSLLNRLDELRGRVRGCWCYPEPSHGDVLAEMINRGA